MKKNISDFAENWKEKLNKKWATLEQIQLLLEHNFITKDEYDYIVKS